MKKTLIKCVIIGTVLSTTVNVCFADVGRYIINHSSQLWTVKADNLQGGDLTDFQAEVGNPSCNMHSEGYAEASCTIPLSGSKPDVYVSYKGIDDDDKVTSWDGILTLSDSSGNSVDITQKCYYDILHGEHFKCETKSVNDPHGLIGNKVAYCGDGGFQLFDSSNGQCQ